MVKSTEINGAPELSDLSKGKKGESKWLPIFLKFIDNLRIQSKELIADDERGSKLDLWGSQRMFLDELCEGMDRGVRTFYCLKSRQIGLSTITGAIDLFWLATHPNIQGALVLDNDENAKFFRTVIKRYHSSLPKSFIGKKFLITAENDKFMSFSNGARLDFLVAGKNKTTWGESRGYTFAHVSEVAKYGKAEGLASFRETLAETHPDRLFIYESTAFGKNHWYDMYMEGKRDTFTKKSIFIGWWSKEINVIPKSDPRFEVYGSNAPDMVEREKMDKVLSEHGIKINQEQLAWIREKESNLSVSKADMDQNQPWLDSDAFVQEGFSFFQTRRCAKLLDYIYDPENGVAYQAYKFILGNDLHNSVMEPVMPGEVMDPSDIDLRVWEQPVEGAKYVIGCDPAYGRNDWKDRHNVSVWRCYADKLIQVAEYADNNVETYQAAWVLAYLAGCYKDCLINIELTGGPGRAVFKELDDKRKEYRSDPRQSIATERDWDNFLGSARYFLYHRPDSMGAGYAYHTDMTGRLKFQVLNQVRDMFMTSQLVIRSAPLVEEMMNVVQDGSKIEAPNKLKDDRVFGMVLACMAWSDWIKPAMIQTGYTYEEAQAQESDTGASPAKSVVRHIVHNFWKTQKQLLEQEQPEVPTFLEERGIYD